jgi:carotenoid cleavage dioxygenase
MSTQAEPAAAPPPKPFHLTGNFAPVADELEVHGLPVEGTLPPELAGTYLRNGPNPRSGMSPHWLVGDGMLHGVHIADGEARWYRNRYVGPGRDVAAPAPALRLHRVSSRLRHNTHVIEHAGRILALVEAGLPMEVDRELASIGLFDFDGRVDTPVAAHPKRCPVSGELHFYGYQHAPPYLTYYVADAAGTVVRREAIDIGGASYMHDFALTERHAIFFDTPVRMTSDWGGAAPMPFAWSDRHQARIVVVPRAGGAARFFDIEPGQLLHTANAYEQGGRIVIEAGRARRYDTPPFFLYRWEVDLASGRVNEQTLDDRIVEFPRIDERRVGLRHRYVYMVEMRFVDGKPAGSQLRRYDTATGASVASSLGPAQVPGECVFVPRSPGADEDDGYLLSIVYNSARGGSDLVVLDARAIDGAPIARVRLPHRVPFGFHGSFVPGPGVNR